MNYIKKIIFIAVAMVTAIPSFAVTDKEMEQARTIAAKHYLRYANNGSDYLDNLHPTSMAELNKELKAKEQENIKSFNGVAVPKDYGTWDKQKLVEYWSNTFFKSPGLKEEGKKCLSILARNLEKIEVGAVSAKDQTPAAPAEAVPAQAQGEATQQPAETENANPAVEDIKASESEADITAQSDAGAGLIDEQPRQKSNTGWYVGILVVLVGVVIWLVMYASKSMKEGSISSEDKKKAEKDIREAQLTAKEEKNKLREQYAGSLNAKNSEIAQLKGKLESATAENDNIKAENESLRRENESLRHELEMLRRNRGAGKPATGESGSVPSESKAESGTSRQGGLPPVVYLGYANQKGLFVKASRTLNAETSVYRMDIPDGHHGEYRVVNDSAVLDRVLDNPGQWLSGGCVIENPEDSDIAAEIITLEPGEALFADNTCRVIKKARIKYI